MPRPKKVTKDVAAPTLRIDEMLFGAPILPSHSKLPALPTVPPSPPPVEVPTTPTKPALKVESEPVPLTDADITVVDVSPTPQLPTSPSPVVLLRQTFRNYFATLEDTASFEDHLKDLEAEFRFLNARCIEAHYLQKEMESLKNQIEDSEAKAEEVLEILQNTEERLHKFEKLTDMLADECGPHLIQSFWRSLTN